VFGVVLLNDWSARDIQAWEYQPLGPFLAKSFATTVSPWIVTLEALAPYRCAAFERAAGDPKPLPYLWDEEDQRAGGFDIRIEMHLNGTRMSRASLRDSYWTMAQLVAHHTSNGCNLRPGDLLGSGTISGATPDSRGSLLELGRGFLEDGDEVIEKGFCDNGKVRIGFGEACGVIQG
jgi:fumarylacetoacetase